MILTKQQGMRIEVKNDPAFGDVATLISPDRQGPGAAWGLLTDDQKGHLNAALKNSCEFYGCTRRDLQWKIDRGGTIHVRKRPRIEL